MEERRLRDERDREERQQQLIRQLKEAQAAVPQQITIQHHKLPKMNEKDDLELFIQQVEAALVSSDIPRDKWTNYLHSQLTLEAKQKVMHLLQEPDSAYDDIRAALMGCAAMSFASAAEAIFTADRGKVTQLPLR